MHRPRAQDVERNAGDPKIYGTWEIRMEHNGEVFTFKLLHYNHNRNVGDPLMANTILVEDARSIADGFQKMKAEMAKHIHEDLF